MIRLYKGWAGFPEANRGLGEWRRVFGGTAQGNAQRQASLVGWSNSTLDGADGLQEERIKDGGSGWVAKDYQCCHESSATLIVMDTADVVRAR